VQVSDPNEMVAALKPVAEALSLLRIPYYVGGSVASSYHGAVRSTMDIDIVCQMREEQIGPFVSQFNDAFYVSEPAIRQAVRRRSCFNLIHFETSFKVDIFISRERPFDQICMDRAVEAKLGGDTGFVIVPMATVEDSIISKLDWYRLTDETSERQWDDVSRLVRLTGSALDRGYLARSAQMVGVSDLLLRLLDRASR
jgi:hypothetical protein